MLLFLPVFGVFGGDWLIKLPESGLGRLSESGFTGLKDKQDFDLLGGGCLNYDFCDWFDYLDWIGVKINQVKKNN